MTKVTDAANQVYQFSYDALGRQLSQTRANATMSYEYDAVGNRTKRTDYNGKITSYEYDTLNRLKKINYLTGADNTVTGDVSSYNYDDLSRLTSAVNQAGTVAFTYDTRGRVKTTTDVFGHLLNYGYDANGNRNLLKLDGTTQTSYAYDAANRLTTLTDEANQNFTFGYDVANRLITKVLPNGVSTSYDYDGMSRLKELKHRFQTTPLFDYQYAYNPANQIGQITEPDETRNFTYDNLDRLTGAVHANNGELDMSYGFDAVGNRISTNSSELISNPHEVTFEANNRLTQTEDGTNYDYDASGNLTAKSPFNQLDIKWAFVWDYENRMISATSSQLASLGRTITKTASYKYDALGRRVKRTDPAGSITKFTYDGMDVVMDDDTISGITKYQNGLGIDDKLKFSINGTAKYFLADHLGSTVGLTDASGAIVEQTAYDSFGNATNNLSTRYQFTGREYDNFTGLQYSRARWYDAKTGRFISEDPIGFAGGDINLYGYVGNNSPNFRDPSGKFIVPLIVGAVVIGGLILASPSPVNAPGRGDPIYYPENPLILNAAGGAVGSFVLGKVFGPVIGRLMGTAESEICELGIASGPSEVITPSSKIPWNSWDGYPKTSIAGEEYAQVGNRLFSHHAVDRMQPSGNRFWTGGQDGGMPQIRQSGQGFDYGRSVAPQFVEDAISSSQGVLQPNGNYSYTSGSLQIILNQRGDVVTIITH